MNNVTKNTFVPISVAVAATIFFASVSVNLTSRLVHLETRIEAQHSTDNTHTSRLIQLGDQLQRLQQNSIKQEQLLKSVDRSLQKIEKRLR